METIWFIVGVALMGIGGFLLGMHAEETRLKREALGTLFVADDCNGEPEICLTFKDDEAKNDIRHVSVVLFDVERIFPEKPREKHAPLRRDQ